MGKGKLGITKDIMCTVLQVMMIVSCDCGVVNTYTKPLGLSLESVIACNPA